MLVLTHILIAISSLVVTTLAFFVPTKTKLNITYALVGLTFLSGTLLVLSMPSHLVSSCISGLLYLGIVLAGIFAARYRLAKQTSR